MPLCGGEGSWHFNLFNGVCVGQAGPRTNTAKRCKVLTCNANAWSSLQDVVEWADIKLERFDKALASYRDHIGLGVDCLHLRSILMLPDEAGEAREAQVTEQGRASGRAEVGLQLPHQLVLVRKSAKSCARGAPATYTGMRCNYVHDRSATHGAFERIQLSNTGRQSFSLHSEP